MRLTAEHPVIKHGLVCPYCENTFQAGDVITLHPLPPDNPEDRAKAAAGRPFTAPAVPMHAACEKALAHENDV